MSHHFSANQYNEPFRPIRLQNYFHFTNTPSPYGVHAMCLPKRCGKTEFIADDNGWLLDGVCRGPSSPWGDYQTSIWEQVECCLCVDKLRHPEKYVCPPKSIFIARDENCHQEEAQKVADKINCIGWDCLTNPPVCYGPGRRRNPCSGIEMKVYNCGSDPVQRKRLLKELRQEQKRLKRTLVAIRGGNKGSLPFTPGEFNAVTWDNCQGGNGNERMFGKIRGCPKGGCAKGTLDNIL